jgi:hypothetical protein
MDLSIVEMEQRKEDARVFSSSLFPFNLSAKSKQSIYGSRKDHTGDAERKEYRARINVFAFIAVSA